MKIIETPIPGLIVIEPKAFGDQRGYFFESYQAKRYHEAGITCDFIQDNVSRSQKGVLRGLHFQTKQAQDKLVMVTRGSVFDVAVDVRVGSPTFGQWYGLVLSDENHKQFFIPKGFAHGFYVMSDIVDFCYKCSDYYTPEYESGLPWNDPDLQINWPIENGSSPNLSAKDQNYNNLKDIAKEKLPIFTN